MSNLSPAPGTPQTADKAKVAATVAGLLVSVLLVLAMYFDDRNGTNWAEILMALVGGVGTAGATGVATFQAKNRAK